MDKENEEVRIDTHLYSESMAKIAGALIETIAKTATASAIYSVERQTGKPMSDEEKNALYLELRAKSTDVFTQEYAD